MCPSSASSVRIVDYDLCMGCRMCMVACPFGAITFDMDRRQVIKCDLCGSDDPWCVRFCETGALTYRLPPVDSMVKQRVAGRRLVEAVERSTGLP